MKTSIKVQCGTEGEFVKIANKLLDGRASVFYTGNVVTITGYVSDELDLSKLVMLRISWDFEIERLRANGVEARC